MDIPDESWLGASEPFGPRDRDRRWQHFLDASGAVEARRRRAGEHWLRRQAEESATLVGVLVDRAERGERSVLHLRSGRSHAGRLDLVGVDVVSIVVAGNRQLLVALGSIVSVRGIPGSPAVVGDRIERPTTTMHDLVSWLIDDPPEVHIWAGAREIRGRLMAVGADVLIVDAGTDNQDIVEHVTLGSVEELLIER